MTVREAIKRADALRPNTLTGEDKAKWLRALEAEYAEMMGYSLKIPNKIKKFLEWQR